MPSRADPSIVEQRIVEQAARLPPQGAVTGWASLRWRGGAFFDGTADGGAILLPVPLQLGLGNLRPHPGSVFSREQFAASEHRMVDGLPCTSVQRAVFDEMRRTGHLRDAVIALDMAMAARLISLELMAAYVDQRWSWLGAPLVRAALLLCDEFSRSPQETRMRLIWLLDALLPRPLCNRPVFDRQGRLLGVPDLLDVEAGLVGEYDGADHKDSARHQRDVAREQVFREHGLEYFTVVGGDMRNHDLMVKRMHGARGRALFLPEDQRAWTLEPPAWWHQPESLDAYLARTGAVDDLLST